MTELKVNVDEPYYVMLKALKPVAESIIEETLDLDTYVNMVLWRGIRGIIEDIIPGDPDILRASILMMYESNPEFVASFINSVMKAGASKDVAKQRLGFIRNQVVSARRTACRVIGVLAGNDRKRPSASSGLRT